MRALLILLIFSLTSLTSLSGLSGLSGLSAADEPKASSVVNLYGVSFTYGIPPWVTPGKDMLSQMKPFRNQAGPSFLVEFIPADEEFDSWSKMFAVSAYRNNKTAPVESWQQVSLASLAKVCSGYRATTLLKAANTMLVKVVCPRVVAAVPMKGYEGGMGQIAVFAFMVSDNVLINHRIEWRGKAFDADDLSSWPVSPADIDEGLEILKQARAVNGKTVVQFSED